MATVHTVFDVITDFLTTDPSTEEILAYKLPVELEQRAHDLMERHRNDQLTFDETLEMQDFMRMDRFMTLLKAKTRLKLK